MQKTLLAIIAAAVVTVGLTVNFATATHQPADKAAATSNDLDNLGTQGGGAGQPPTDGDLLLSETMRVSSTSDLILQTTAECSILTSLHTAGGEQATSETDGAFGQVKMWLEIDGKRVPVSTNDTATDPNDGSTDTGEVVFCNRAHARKVVDQEENEGTGGNTNGDGIDEQDDFIRTRNANGFNWMAFDVGTTYDEAAVTNGNNIVEVKLFGEYDRNTSETTGGTTTTPNQGCGTRQADNALAPYGKTCAEAFVGSRSLIIEAVHAANHEQAAPNND